MASIIELAEALEEDAKDKEGPIDVRDDLANTPGVAGWAWGRFFQHEHARDYQETIWRKLWNQFRAEPGTTPKVRSSEKSEVNVKITKVKVLTAYGHTTDAMFGQSRFPMVVESTEIPRGIADKVHLDPTGGQAKGKIPDPFGYKGDGREVLPGAIGEIPLGGLEEELEGASLLPGPGKAGEPTISPAKMAAARMDKVIQDQLQDNKAVEEFSKAIWEASLLGTGIIKGPFTHSKTIHKWVQVEDEEGDEPTVGKASRVYSPSHVSIPKIKYRSVWNVYPDPDATSVDEIQSVFERHRMSESDLTDLALQKGFNVEAITRCVERGPSYEKKDWEDVIFRNDTHVNFENRYEVLEYWGMMPRAEAVRIGLAKEGEGISAINVNIWVCGTEILRAIKNPFTPNRIPYHFIPYEVNPYSVWGIGVAENMQDAQQMMNGHMRMGIDNQALAGNVILEVDESNLVAGQDLDWYPGKTYYRKSGAKGKGISSVQIQNTGTTSIEFYRLARQLADEETGIPSIMHGQTGVSGTGRTASGMSMLLGGSSVNIKTVVKNFDNYGIKPVGECYFQWNMQFNDEDIGIIGDLEIKPKATAAMISKEVKSQRLESLLGIAVNPALAPFFKLDKLVGEIVRVLDMDPEDYVNSPQEAAVYAKVLRGLLSAQGAIEQPIGGGEQPSAMGASPAVPGGPPQGDPRGTGNGGIVPATPSGPGTSGFTGTPQ